MSGHSPFVAALSRDYLVILVRWDGSVRVDGRVLPPPLRPWRWLAAAAPGQRPQPLGRRQPGCPRCPPPRGQRSARLRSTLCASVTTRAATSRSEEHTSELQSRQYLVCRLLP